MYLEYTADILNVSHDNFICRHSNKEVRKLWEKGLPPSVRGDVWIRAIGNYLGITKGLYKCVRLFWKFQTVYLSLYVYLLYCNACL